ncbi:MAG TPA: N(4)-(beta-N-acetylglucosaminyl)-L-asparaginase [Segetibacter sp.]
MSTRRRFLQTSILSSIATVVGNAATGRANKGNFIKKNNPVVISTWDFGREANIGAWEILSKGGSALDAVEAGVRIPEADPTNQTVGYGGLPDRDGNVTLDACIMDEKYNCGAVLCLEHIMHPISVARLVMERTPHIYLAGEGALQFALANGFTKQNLLTEQSEKAWKNWLKKAEYKPQINIENQRHDKENGSVPGDASNHDTIGMIALDATGNLSGACTTSGMAFKMRGRVGDSPIIGSGLYVDNEVGAATATGVGEEVIRIAGAHLVVELMRQGKRPSTACREAVERIVKRNPTKAKNIQVAFIALNKQGEYGAYSLQQGFMFSVRNSTIEKIIKVDNYYP